MPPQYRVPLIAPPPETLAALTDTDGTVAFLVTPDATIHACYFVNHAGAYRLS